MPVGEVLFKSAEYRKRYLSAYEDTMKTWPVPYEELDVPTTFGSTHGIVCGQQGCPPVVLLHGNFISLTMWRHNVASLGECHRVYAFDTIDDLGKSIPESLPRSRADYALWLSEVIRGVGLTRTSIVGLSYGGFLALNLALAQPAMVDKLVLLAPGVPLAPPTPRWMFGMPMIVWPTPFTIRLFFERVSLKGHFASGPELVQLTTGIPGLLSRTPLRPEFTDEEFGRLAVPTLLLVGDHEMLYDAQSAVQHARKLFPDIQAEVIRDSGHALNADQPETTNTKIKAFLGATRDRDARSL